MARIFAILFILPGLAFGAFVFLTTGLAAFAVMCVPLYVMLRIFARVFSLA